MTEEKLDQQYPRINKVKIYLIAIILIILVNTVAETILTQLENTFQQWLYPAFPYSRLWILIIGILLTNSYIRSKQHKPKQKRSWRIIKLTLILLMSYGLFMAGWFAIANADLERTRNETQEQIKSAEDILPPPPQLQQVNNPDFHRSDNAE